ncbi:helix-turn-helix transcriptional regulator [Azoarcus sp. DN11]|uniref:helix-turn-helix domain-containing protein n=1 Tax=Azoarcus sp. DN11 TaxID=356837 RepID=UPI000EB49587|nr:helix-turn-helix transcriptional regulator [Azoarcus sp. DN11]AYH42719.1 hypothetical protein CDA09_04860 [Azoarcus sp. DN11]
MQQTTITPSRSRDARRELGLSQADVATSLSINRAYLSDFENGHLTRLTKAQLRKLRDLYEAKAEEARANGDEVELSFAEAEITTTEVPEIRSYTDDGLMFRAVESVSKEALAATKEAIKSNDIRLVALLNNELQRNESFFGDGELSADTQHAIGEAYSLLAANYLLLRSVTGWPEVGLNADSIGLADNTIAGAMIEQARESFVRAGLIEEQSEEGGEA